jgi:hypothetical protein
MDDLPDQIGEWTGDINDNPTERACICLFMI